jgi:hypothetical protein
MLLSGADAVLPTESTECAFQAMPYDRAIPCATAH